jgi:hypothetical protein
VKELLAWKQELTRDLGGETALTVGQKTLIELACRKRLFIDVADHYLLSLDSIIVGKKNVLHPLVAQRMQLDESLQRTLLALGLERIPQPLEVVNPSAIQLALDALKRVPKPKPKGDEDGPEPERPTEVA